MRIVFFSRSLFTNNLKDRLPHLTNSICICQFTCSYGVRYIVVRCVLYLKGIHEHYPEWLKRGGNSPICSSMIKRLVNIGHSIKTDSTSKLIYKVNSSLPKAITLHFLNIDEAIAIHLGKPELRVQKRLIQPLLLPWSLCLITGFSFFLTLQPSASPSLFSLNILLPTGLFLFL